MTTTTDRWTTADSRLAGRKGLFAWSNGVDAGYFIEREDGRSFGPEHEEATIRTGGRVVLAVPSIDAARAFIAAQPDRPKRR